MNKTKRDYSKLLDYLIDNKTLKGITLTFKEIEKIIQAELPPSAYKYRSWWANDETHPHANTWMNACFLTKDVKLGVSVTFYLNY